jgi:CubicO group peptidase (beta-lactamase class C family)
MRVAVAAAVAATFVGSGFSGTANVASGYSRTIGIAASPAISAAGRAGLSAFLKSAVAADSVPGIVALVTGPDGEIYVEAVGRSRVADNRPMRSDSIFRIASMTKPVTSVAAMMLYEQGRLSLDEPVKTYLPDYKQPPVLVSSDRATGKLETRPSQRPITIRHLLTHTSGIAYAFDAPVLAALQEAGTKDDDFPLLHEPGEKWTYGSSTRLLGRVVEKISGQPLDEVFRRRVFDPLKMSDTSYAVRGEKLERLVTWHQRKSADLAEMPVRATETAPVRGDGGLYSTASDYGAFLRMFINRGSAPGGRLLSANTVDMMTRDQIAPLTVREMPAAMPAIALAFPTGVGRDTFGLGFQIAARGSSPRSAGSYSWAGVFNTFFWVDPDRRIGVVLLMQVLPFFDDACKSVVTGFEERLYKAMN